MGNPTETSFICASCKRRIHKTLSIQGKDFQVFCPPCAGAEYNWDMYIQVGFIHRDAELFIDYLRHLVNEISAVSTKTGHLLNRIEALEEKVISEEKS